MGLLHQARVVRLSYEEQMRLLSSESERIAEAARQVLLEHMVDRWWQREKNNSMDRYPVSLYLAINGVLPSQITSQKILGQQRQSAKLASLVTTAVKTAIQAGMQRTKTGESLDAYREEVYSYVSAYFGTVAGAAREPLDSAFEALTDRFGTWAEPFPKRKTGSTGYSPQARQIAVVSARYGSYNIRTLDEIGKHLGVDLERVRQLEGRGLALLSCHENVRALGPNVLETCLQRFKSDYEIEGNKPGQAQNSAYFLPEAADAAQAQDSLPVEIRQVGEGIRRNFWRLHYSLKTLH